MDDPTEFEGEGGFVSETKDSSFLKSPSKVWFHQFTLTKLL